MLDRQHRGYAGFLALLIAGVTAFACSSSESGGASSGGKCTKSQDCAGQPCVKGVCQGSMDGGSGGSTTGAGGSTSDGGSTSGGGATSDGGATSGGGSTSDSGASSGGTSGSDGGSVPSGSPAGSSCKAPSDCQSGVCTGGLCMPSGMLPNTTCSTGADCASGVCVSGKCQIPAGASGTVDQTECMAGSLGCACQPMNKCKAPLVCTAGICGQKGAPAGAGGSSGGTGGACKPGVVGPVITECGYPYSSSNALTNILFNESAVLAAIVPSGGYPFASIQLFYNDEHAMTLGLRETVINGVTKTYPVSALTKSPDIVNSPETGSNLIIGQQAGVDPVGRPMWPALFITDITKDPSGVSGDWQWGGPPINPTYVAGTWKGAVRTVTATGASITPDADPVKNNMNYGNGHTPPAGAITKAESYGTEVRWDIRLEAGHNYRFQVMVHDGDQNKVGGDSGEACVTFCADNSCPEGSQSCTKNADCASGDTCTGGCCIGLPPPPPDAGAGGSRGSGGTSGSGNSSGSGGSSSGCPGDLQVLPNSNGMCTPPPMNGGCPEGYLITILYGQQYCAPLQIR
jgi:hypothetical protein